ncbi:MAG: polypeptide-transport-associated protein, partial [Rhizobacter sp.]|nr:polypeptide-transport-associated protein [Rhizobacter sp.]
MSTKYPFPRADAMSAFQPAPRGLRSHRATLIATALGGLVASLCGQAAHAQADAGTLLRELPPPVQPAAPARTPSVVPAVPPSAAVDSQLRINVTRFVVRGATLIPETELQTLLAPYLGDRSFADLQKAADAIAAAYRARGLLARALLPEQALTGGVVTIAVVEARLGGVRIDKGEQGLRLRESTVRNFMLA